MAATTISRASTGDDHLIGGFFGDVDFLDGGDGFDTCEIGVTILNCEA